MSEKDIIKRLNDIDIKLGRLDTLPLKRTGIDIIDFPNSDKWGWKSVILDSKIVLANSKISIYNEVGNGYIYYIWIYSNNPLLSWIAEYDANGSTRLATDFATEYALGGVQSMGGFRITKYDDVNSIYTMEFSPGIFGGLGLPFRGRSNFFLSNPTSSSITFAIYASLIMVNK